MSDDYDKAIADYRTAIRLNADDVSSLNNLAWILATCTKDSLRNGAKAVMLVVQAKDVLVRESPELLDTLAAAYAQAGRFPEAIATAREAIQLAGELKNKSLADRLRSRLALYEAKKPFRQPLARRKSS